MNLRSVFASLHFLCMVMLLARGLSSLAAQAAAEKAERRGGWEGSGGDGVACWTTQREAKSAEEEIRATGFLSEKSKQGITSLETLEHWEFKEKVTFPELAKEHQVVLQRVHKLLEDHAPIFASRLQVVNANISVDSWQNVKDVAEIPDSIPSRSVEGENGRCRLVQLAARFSKSRGITNFPEVFVQIDKFLFAKLNPLNQAMLILHEELYLLGRLVNHYNSNDVRKVVARLASNDFQAMALMGVPPVQISARLQGFLVAFFGDYVQFFSEDIPLLSGGARNQYTRYRSFLAANEKMRAANSACHKELGFEAAAKEEQARIIESCRFRIFRSSELLGGMSPEEAFVFLARYHLQYSLFALNSEHLMVFNLRDPLAVSAEQKNMLSDACSLLREKKPELPAWDTLLPRALEYCNAL